MSTHRNAKVMVENQTGQGILSVSIAHKYSDDYKNNHNWEGPIQNGAPTNPDMIVDYTTGFGTTGRDWWVVTWITEDGAIHITDPKNFRGLIDMIEKVASSAAISASSLAISLAAAPEPAITKATAAAVAVTGLVVKGLTNSESTKGFKQHILRSEDEDVPTKIIIKSDSVIFNSQSGDSTTGISTTVAGVPA